MKKSSWSQFKENLESFRKKVTYYLFAPHLETEEKIMYVVHRHPFLMIKKAIIIGFFHFFLPVFWWFVFPEIWYIFSVWLLYGLISLNRMIFNWYFDVVLVTDVSLVDIKWNGMFDRSSTRLEYSMIEGTSHSFKGILQTFFNYGAIVVNRQGGDAGVQLSDAIDPAKAESIILGYQDKYLAKKGLEDVKNLKSLLGNMLKKHAEELKEIQVDF